jgi:hypothetical protein
MFFRKVRAAAVVLVSLEPIDRPGCRPRVKSSFDVSLRLRSRFLSGMVKVLRPFLKGALIRKFSRIFSTAKQVGILLEKEPEKTKAELLSYPGLSAAERAEAERLLAPMGPELAACGVRFPNLEVRLVSESGGKELPSWQGSGPVAVESEVLFSGADFEAVEPSLGGDDRKTPALWLRFTKEAGRRFERVTSRYSGRRIAFVIGDKVASAPKILHPISTGLFEITGPSEAVVREMSRAAGTPLSAP